MRYLSIIALLLFTGCANEPKATPQQPTTLGKSMQEKTGIQLYSLRDQFAKDVPGTLDYIAKTLQLKTVELGGFYGQTATQFKTALDKAGLKPEGVLFPFGNFRDSIDLIVKDCQALGVSYAGCAWIDHEGDDFKREDAEKAIAVFNAAAEKLSVYGIKLYYHTHGYEFKPCPEGTFFDLMAQQMNPVHTTFELDTYWVHHGGVNPVELMQKYPGRFWSLHIKDMKKGVETGIFTGHSPVENCVVAGTGQIDMKNVLSTALATGVKQYFIEDEHPDVQAQVPLTLKYMYGL